MYKDEEVAGQVNCFFFKTAALIKENEGSEIKKGQSETAPFLPLIYLKWFPVRI